MKYLFVGGCPRSGTTALLQLLNSHPGIALGKERYKNVQGLTPRHFETDQFLHPSAEETNLLDMDHYAALRRKMRRGDILYIGDKTPGYYRRISELSQAFEQARFLMIWRDPVRVASSFQHRAQRAAGGWSEEHDYRNAIRQWNSSLTRYRQFMRQGGHGQLMLLHYEWLYSGDFEYLRSVFRFLGLDVTDEVIESYVHIARRWNRVRKKSLCLTEEQIGEVKAGTDPELEAWALGWSALQFLQHLSPHSPPPDSQEFAVSRQYSAFTAQNRLEQMRALANKADSSADTDQRVADVLVELARRAEEIEQKAERILDQIRAAEASAWSRLGANLDLRKPRKIKSGERTVSQQASELAESLAQYRLAIQDLSHRFRQ
ncbi:MAG: sulfotransferase [Xanthomonadales bacterium]|nr:sulfotransferase [Xanthomonadales bacterium]